MILIRSYTVAWFLNYYIRSKRLLHHITPHLSPDLLLSTFLCPSYQSIMFYYILVITVPTSLLVFVIHFRIYYLHNSAFLILVLILKMTTMMIVMILILMTILMTIIPFVDLGLFVVVVVDHDNDLLHLLMNIVFLLMRNNSNEKYHVYHENIQYKHYHHNNLYYIGIYVYMVLGVVVVVLVFLMVRLLILLVVV